MSWKLRSTFAFALVLASCAAAEGTTLIDEPLGELPQSLSGLGLYPTGSLGEVDSRAVEYAPTHELWSNGSAKFRYLVLPEGTEIDASDPEEWTFPVGTLLFKTFTYPREDGTLRPIETRVMRLDEDGDWELASYRWTDDESGAQAELRVAEPVAVEAFGEAFEHSIPSHRQCRQCHEAGDRRVLGLNDRSLADASGGQSELDRLVALGVVDLGGRTPVAIPEYEDAEQRAVIAYVWANCSHCHHGEPGPNASFDLAPEVFLENTVDRDTESEASAAGIRILPGDAENSVMVSAMIDDDGARAMPPVGIDRRDAESIERMRQWIETLE